MKRFINANSLATLTFACALIAATNWGLSTAKKHFDQSVRHDLAAAAALSKVQLHGERLRRFEKEMFIYAGNSTKRAGYVKEFDQTYDKLLWELDTALMPSGKAFTQEERDALTKWKLDAIYYYGQFQFLAARASQMDMSAFTDGDAGRLTVEFNAQIASGKDRFRELLTGADKLRVAKEAHAQAVAEEVDRVFVRTSWLVTLLSVLGCITIPFMAWRGRHASPAQAKSTDMRRSTHAATRPLPAMD